jgi:hypothetical protein
MNVTDFYGFDHEGIYLEKFLHGNKDKLKGKRGFYVLSFQMDRDVDKKLFKIGVAHRALHDRLKSYIVSYGKNDGSCHGVLIHYLGTTANNTRVENKKSAIGRLERSMINNLVKFKVPRGSERFRLGTSELKKILYQTKQNVKDTVSKTKMALRSKDTK